MALGSTQALTEMSTRSISWGQSLPVRMADNLPPSCAVVKKSGNPNFLETSGPFWACNGTALPFTFRGVGGQRHAPAALPPGKTRNPSYRRLGGPQGRSGGVQNISPPPVFHPQTFQFVSSLYTDCAIPAHIKVTIKLILCISRRCV